MLSSSSASGEESLVAATKQKLSTLHVQRQALESEAEAIISELTTPPAPDVRPAGIDDPLVDREGYPRGDVDVYRVRTLRGRLAEIKTDRQSLLDESERLLHQLAMLQNPGKAAAVQAEAAARVAPKPKPKFDPVSGKWVVRNWDGTLSGSGSGSGDRGSNEGRGRSFDALAAASSEQSLSSAALAAQASLDASAPASSVSLDESYRSVRPFARVNSVAESSPASLAGLRPDDLLLRFGTAQIDGAAHEDSDSVMAFVGQTVPQLASQGSSVQVVVRRSTDPSAVSNTLQLTLTPRPWAGRGLLGCHIVPYKE
jgi:26S proteasome regulatory subunit N4